MPKRTSTNSSLYTSRELMALALCAGVDVRTVRRFLDGKKVRDLVAWRLRYAMKVERFHQVLKVADTISNDSDWVRINGTPKGGAR